MRQSEVKELSNNELQEKLSEIKKQYLDLAPQYTATTSVNQRKACHLLKTQLKNENE